MGRQHCQTPCALRAQLRQPELARVSQARQKWSRCFAELNSALEECKPVPAASCQTRTLAKTQNKQQIGIPKFPIECKLPGAFGCETIFFISLSLLFNLLMLSRIVKFCQVF
jgi:hypothetical protein